MTAEIVGAQPFTAEEAERHTQRTLLGLERWADAQDRVLPMIREAIDRNAATALGYKGVSDYIADRFGAALTRIGMDMRRDVVRELTEAGMSTRAIAPVVGVSNKTVHQDLATVTSGNSPINRPAMVTSLDGRERPSTQPGREFIDRGTGEIQPEPRQRAYSPRTDVVLTINSALTKARDAGFQADQIKAEHLSNRSEEAAAWGRSLSESIQSLQRLMDLLTEASR